VNFQVYDDRTSGHRQRFHSSGVIYFMGKAIIPWSQYFVFTVVTLLVGELRKSVQYILWVFPENFVILHLDTTTSHVDSRNKQTVNATNFMRQKINLHTMFSVLLICHLNRQTKILMSLRRMKNWEHVCFPCSTHVHLFARDPKCVLLPPTITFFHAWWFTKHLGATIAAIGYGERNMWKNEEKWRRANVYSYCWVVNVL